MKIKEIKVYQNRNHAPLTYFDKESMQSLVEIADIFKHTKYLFQMLISWNIINKEHKEFLADSVNNSTIYILRTTHEICILQIEIELYHLANVLLLFNLLTVWKL